MAWIIGKSKRREFVGPGDLLEDRPERARVYTDRERADGDAASMNKFDAGLPLRFGEQWAVLDAPAVNQVARFIAKG